MLRRLADETWRQLPPASLLLVPVGSIEQHGPHLPLDTDTVIAVAVADKLADALAREHRRSDVLVAPPVAYGASGEHQSFAGTSSIGTPVLRAVLLELTRSMRTWARRVVYVNGHGGNVCAITAAVTQLLDEGHDVDWVLCSVPGADLHAGRVETSLLLHLRPASVRWERTAPGNCADLRTLLPALRAEGVAAVSPNGVLGDPAGASAAEGARLLEAMTQHALAQLASARVR